MDGARFDALTRLVDGATTRRRMMSLIGAVSLATMPASGAAKKKSKFRRCRTVGGFVLCRKSRICCSPTASTIGGCAPKGFPVCCLAAGFAFPAGTTCCDEADAGSDGACQDPDYPNCCPPEIAGCCIDGLSLCCVHPTEGPYCCPGTSTCCPDEPDGCCDSQPRESRLATARIRRGGWLAPDRSEAGRSGGGRQRFEPAP